MKIDIKEFKKTKPFLVCIDSDGCAMDTMESKHRKSFGPMAVETWEELRPVEKKFLEKWNEINLYSKKRGINRFLGIVEAFKQMEYLGYSMPPNDVLREWSEETTELSARALEEAQKEMPNKQYEAALLWSRKVNESITANTEEDQPFEFVLDTLKHLSEFANIAIVSSANSEAIQEEWTKHGLSEYVDVMCGQESGTKAECIKQLKHENRYSRHEILMIGDALGDYEAAWENHVLFYPIIPLKEKESWKRFFKEGLSKFRTNTYAGKYEDQLLEEFHRALE